MHVCKKLAVKGWLIWSCQFLVHFEEAGNDVGLGSVFREAVGIHLGAFLLNEHFGGGNIAVDEVRALLFEDGLDRDFKLHHCHGIVYAEDGMEEVQPEALGLSLFIAFAGPVLDELFCCLFLVIGCAHNSIMFPQTSEFSYFSSYS